MGKRQPWLFFYFFKTSLWGFKGFDLGLKVFNFKLDNVRQTSQFSWVLVPSTLCSGSTFFCQWKSQYSLYPLMSHSCETKSRHKVITFTNLRMKKLNGFPKSVVRCLVHVFCYYKSLFYQPLLFKWLE